MWNPLTERTAVQNILALLRGAVDRCIPFPGVSLRSTAWLHLAALRAAVLHAGGVEGS